MTPTVENIIRQLNQLSSIVRGEIPAYVRPTIIEPQVDCKSIDLNLVDVTFPITVNEMSTGEMSKDEFIDRMASLSLTHMITYISYDATFGTTVMVNMNVHVAETTDFNTNITPEVMELFYNLPIH